MTSFESRHVEDQGRFRRKTSEFRDHITTDGSTRFAPEAHRYHIYIAWACPWAHRTLLARHFLGLHDVIDVSVVHWLMDDRGAWHFRTDEGYTDDLHGAQDLQEVYQRADPGFPSIGTVPVLWDKKHDTIVNNESREIVRMLSTAFNELQENEVTLLPDGMQEDIDRTIDGFYEPINNGVYKSGFARTQQAYDEAVTELFDALQQWDDHLADNRYIMGETFTEADICMFPTLIRFDPVYHHHFKCNIKRLTDHENLWAYTREIYQMPGVRDTIDMADTKRHYYGSHTSINPHRIVPQGPQIDLDEPHGRERLPGKIARRAVA